MRLIRSLSQFSENNEISIWNNGDATTVVHGEENLCIPKMMFGHLFTSSRSDDVDAKTINGRNSCGVKLCNEFSKRFVVETASKECNKIFRQTWGNSKFNVSETEVEEFNGEDYTKVYLSGLNLYLYIHLIRKFVQRLIPFLHR